MAILCVKDEEQPVQQNERRAAHIRQWRRWRRAGDGARKAGEDPMEDNPGEVTGSSPGEPLRTVRSAGGAKRNPEPTSRHAVPVIVARLSPEHARE
jgi:hypothetical protein